jgi:uncharacterized protein
MVGDLHRQRVLKFLEEFYSGDIEAALARCSDDVDFVANAPIDILPHMGHRHGKAEVRTMWQTIHGRYSHMRHEVPILVAEGDRVAANIRAYFRKRSNNRIVQFDIAVFYTLRDSRIAEIREIIDTFDLVQQLLERDVAADLTDKKSHEIYFSLARASSFNVSRSCRDGPKHQTSNVRLHRDIPRIRVGVEPVIGPRFAPIRRCRGMTLHCFLHFRVEPSRAGGDQTGGSADIDPRKSPQKHP